MLWVLLVLLYGIFKGIRDVAKKKALEKNGLVEVLLVYTFLSFLMVTPDIGHVSGVAPKDMLLIAFKSFIIFGSFTLSFYAIKKMPVSLYGVLELSRMIFSMVLSVFILKETIGLYEAIGMGVVMLGLILLKFTPGSGKKNDKGESREGAGLTLLVVLTLLSCFLGALSGVMDKILMRTLTSAQLQFWYMLFLLIYYGIFTIITKTRVQWKSVFKNPWVWLISVLFIIADRALFIANGIPESQVSVMTVLKQVCVVVTIITGRIIFKEKHILYRLFCAAVIIAGIIISVI